MSSPYLHGIQSSAFLSFIYQSPTLLKELRTPHKYFKDNYEAIYKHFGLMRHEMLTVMCDISKVDVLIGTEIVEYVE
jgi:hypothetical protein